MLTALVVARCGASSNFNAPLFVDPNEKAYSTEYLLEKAVHYYDVKDYANAKKYASKILAINPTSEDASILMGYVSLADAGIEIFGLTGRMMDMSTTNTNSSTNTSSSNTTTNLDAASTATSSATSVLDKLQTAIFPSADAIEAALTVATVTINGVTVNGENTADYNNDSSYALKFPVITTVARDETTAIVPINDAMNFVCPMVAAAAKAIEPARYQNCPEHAEPVRQNAKIHFLWGLAHLTEAVAFYAPLMQVVTPLNKRVTSLQASEATPAGISSFISKIKDLAADVAYIFPDDGSAAQKTSLLNAIFSDLKTTNLAFGQIEGMPTQVTDSINNALNSLMDAQNQIKTGTNSASSTANVQSAQLGKLKDQFTADMAQKLGAKITDLNNSSTPLSTKQVTDACGAIQALSTTTASNVALCNP